MDTKNLKKIFVIGGTGRTGDILIQKLVNKGYYVTSTTRSDLDKCKSYGELHNWVKYDFSSNDNSLSELLTGYQAVISTLGARKGSPKDLYFTSYTKLVEIMNKVGVDRLIAVTADGTHSGHSFLFKYFFKIFFLSSVLKDMEKTEAYFRDNYSGSVKWTFIRPFRLLDGEKKSYRVAFDNEYPIDGKQWTWESFTGDVAQFCVDELEQSQFVNKLISTGV